MRILLLTFFLAGLRLICIGQSSEKSLELNLGLPVLLNTEEYVADSIGGYSNVPIPLPGLSLKNSFFLDSNSVIGLGFGYSITGFNAIIESSEVLVRGRKHNVNIVSSYERFFTTKRQKRISFGIGMGLDVTFAGSESQKVTGFSLGFNAKRTVYNYPLLRQINPFVTLFFTKRINEAFAFKSGINAYILNYKKSFDHLSLIDGTAVILNVGLVIDPSKIIIGIRK